MAEKFRKKPVVIEAIQFDATRKNLAVLIDFVAQRNIYFDPEKGMVHIPR